MNYVILGKPMQYAEPSYRGLHRNNPEHIDDPVIIKYWDWYIDNFGDAQYLNDCDKKQAYELIKEYKKHGLNYELIRVANDFEENNKDQFIGIDIATRGGYSILQMGLHEDFTKGKPGPLDGITELLYLYFQPKLNEYLLLQEKTDADLFYKVVKEMRAICPGYFEVEEFYPQYLFVVRQ